VRLTCGICDHTNVRNKTVSGCFWSVGKVLGGIGLEGRREKGSGDLGENGRVTTSWRCGRLSSRRSARQRERLFGISSCKERIVKS